MVTSRTAFDISIIAAAVIYACLPCLSSIKSDLVFNTVFSIFNVAVVSIFVLNLSAGQLFLQNASTQDSIPLVLAISQLTKSLATAALISLQTSTFSWSTADPEHSVFPFDYHLPFYLAVMIMILGYLPVAIFNVDFDFRTYSMQG